MQENAILVPADSAAAAILAACRWLSETKAFVFIENDADFLLHRLPEKVKTAHYHDDETHIRALPEKIGLQPNGGVEPAAATVRGLILTIRSRLERAIHRCWECLCVAPAWSYLHKRKSRRNAAFQKAFG